MKKITILFALFIGIMFGCQNSDLEIAPAENLTGNEQFLPLRETLDFIYKGVTYSSPYHMENDTLMILEDEKVAALYNQLQELPELATYVTPNGNAEYFDTYNDLLEEHPTKTIEITPYSMYLLPVLIFYEHARYNLDREGRGFTFNLSQGMAFRDLSAFGIDDMVSSVRVCGPFGTIKGYGEGITFFRNKNFEAQSITFPFHEGIYDNEVPNEEVYYYLKVENFHNYKVKKKINWNDRISSFKVF